MFAYMEKREVETPKLKEDEYSRILHNCVVVWNEYTRLASVYVKEENSWKKIFSDSRPYFFGKEVCDDQNLFIAFKTRNGLKNLLNCKTGKIIFGEEFKTCQILDRVSIKNDPNQTIFILERLEDDRFVMIDADGNTLLDDSIMKEIKWIRVCERNMGGMTFISFAKKSDTKGMGYYVLFDHKIKLVAYRKDCLINMSCRALADAYGRIHYPVFYTESPERSFFDINGIEIFAN